MMASKVESSKGTTSDETPPSLCPEQTLKATKALVSHMKKVITQEAMQERKRNPLEDPEAPGSSTLSETPVTLVVTTKTFMAKTHDLKPYKISLPRPLFTAASSASVCLIVADPQRKYKDVVAAEEFPADLRQRIGCVLGFDKLRRRYGSFESQRLLFSSYDIFLADDRIVNRLPKVLGKTFYKSTRKRPVPVVISPPKPPKMAVARSAGLRPKASRDEVAAREVQPEVVASELTKAIGAALVHITPSTNVTVTIGFADWDPAHLAENAAVVTRCLVEKRVPRHWDNIRSIYIKGPTTVALPIWMTEKLWVDEASVATPVPAKATGRAL